MNRLLIYCSLVVFLLFSNGCATIFVRGGFKFYDLNKERNLYPATIVDCQLISAPFTEKNTFLESPGFSIFVMFLTLLDFPISVVFDTILIPLDIQQVLEEKHRREEWEKQQNLK